jgi:hypothetical protein
MGFMVGNHKATYEHFTIIISAEMPYLKIDHGIKYNMFT